jgi:enamine deaminase RidA (YjgF/YER057c/UK114 family)
MASQNRHQLSTTINPPSVPAPQPQFSQVNTFVFNSPTKLIAITGQLAIQPDPSKATPAGFDDQVRLALQNLENCLIAAGATKRDIFKVTHYVKDFDYEKQNPASIFIEWLEKDEMAKGHRPASCMMPVQRLAGPDWMYEIETWAVVAA